MLEHLTTSLEAKNLLKCKCIRLIKTIMLNLWLCFRECPESYFIGKLQPHHFKIVSDSWPYYHDMPHREHYIKYSIEHFESIGLFTRSFLPSQFHSWCNFQMGKWGLGTLHLSIGEKDSTQSSRMKCVEHCFWLDIHHPTMIPVKQHHHLAQNLCLSFVDTG